MAWKYSPNTGKYYDDAVGKGINELTAQENTARVNAEVRKKAGVKTATPATTAGIAGNDNNLPSGFMVENTDESPLSYTAEVTGQKSPIAYASEKVKEIVTGAKKGISDIFESAAQFNAGELQQRATTVKTPNGDNGIRAFYPTSTGKKPAPYIPRSKRLVQPPKTAGIGEQEREIPPLPTGIGDINNILAQEQPEIPPLTASAATPSIVLAATTTPAIATPTWTDKLKGIGEGIGTWASDPKISRALMTAGLSTLATEPRRIPYSNAEMIGRAGLAGIGAFDTEVAKEAAGREATRKAGIEGRKEVREITAGDIQNKYNEAKIAAEAAGLDVAKTPIPPLIARRLGVPEGTSIAAAKEMADISSKLEQKYGENTPDLIQLASFYVRNKIEPTIAKAIERLEGQASTRKGASEEEFIKKAALTFIDGGESEPRAVAKAMKLSKALTGGGGTTETSLYLDMGKR